MAIQDRTLTLKGDQAEVLKVEAVKNPDGSYKLVAFGKTSTSDGKEVILEAGNEDVPASNPALSGIWARALTALRRQNGLE